MLEVFIPIISDRLSVQEMGRFDEPGIGLRPVVYYDVFEEGEAEPVGNFGLTYNYKQRDAIISVGLVHASTNKGYGKAIYTNVPKLPLPCGKNFDEMSFAFKSDNPSESAARVWRSLVRSGLAFHCQDGSYQLL
jgi:hypothetical protein